MTFEDLGSDHLSVQGSAEVYELTAPRNPTTLIRRNQAWRVDFDWKSQGPDNHIIAGTWDLKIYLERMGGAEFNFPNPAGINSGTASEPVVSLVSASEYSKYIDVSAFVVPAGLYKLVASITHRGPLGAPSRVAGFAEGPLLQFYDVAP
jgi:hypothetical protein